MSERYGICQVCCGNGTTLRHISESPGIHHEVECGACGGTGFTGDAFARDLLPVHNRSGDKKASADTRTPLKRLEDAVRAVERSTRKNGN